MNAHNAQPFTERKTLIALAVLAAVLAVVMAVCIPLASGNSSAATDYQLHFEPNGGKVFCGDTEAPYYVAVSDEAQMIYVPGATFSVRVPDPSTPFNNGLDFKLLNGEDIVDEGDDLGSYFTVTYAGSDSTYVFTVVVNESLYTNKTGWDKIVIHPQRDGVPTSSWGVIRLIPKAEPAAGSSATFGGVGHTDSLEILSGASSTVYLTITDNMNYDEVEYRYVKEGYSLAGWSPDRVVTAESEIYPENMVMSIDHDLSLYAVWVPNTYTIRLIVGETTSDYRIAYDQNLDTTHMKNMVPSDMTDYAIVGWSPTVLETVVESRTVNTQSVSSTVYILSDEASAYPLNIKYREVPEDGILTLYPIYAIKTTIGAQTKVTLSNAQGCYYFTGTGSDAKITVTDNRTPDVNTRYPYVFVDNLNITSASDSPLSLTGKAKVFLTVLGDSTFTGGNDDPTNSLHRGFAGINVKSNTTLEVTALSTGTLTAKGGDVLSGELWYGTSKSGAGIGSNWNTSLDDEGCGNIIVNGGTVYAVGGTAHAHYTGRFYRAYAGGTLISAQGIGGSGAVMTFNAGAITSTTGKIWRYDDNVNESLLTDVGTPSEPLYYTVPNSNITVNKSQAIVIAVGLSGGTTIGDDLVKIQFIFTGNPIGGAQTVTFIFDGVEHGINLGGAMITSGDIFEIPSSSIKAGAEVKLNTQKGNYFTADSSHVTYDSVNKRYRIEMTHDTGSYHGDVNITVNESAVNQSENYFGEIDLYESFNIEGSNDNTDVTITLTLLDTYVLKSASITQNKGSGASISFVKSGNVYIVTAHVMMGQGDPNQGGTGGITNNINLEIDRKLDTVEFNIHYNGDQADIEDILSALVNSPEPLSRESCDGVWFELWNNDSRVKNDQALQSPDYFTVKTTPADDSVGFTITIKKALVDANFYSSTYHVRIYPTSNGEIQTQYGFVKVTLSGYTGSATGNFDNNNDLTVRSPTNNRPTSTVYLTLTYEEDRPFVQNVYHNDSRTYLIDITHGGNSLYLSGVYLNSVRDDIPAYDFGEGGYLYTINNITGNVTVDLYFVDSVKVTLDQPAHTVTQFVNLNRASMTGDSDPANGYIYIRSGTYANFTVDIAPGDEGYWGISYIMKNGSSSNFIPFRLGHVYTTGNLTADLVLTPYVTNLIPYVYLASNPQNLQSLPHLYVAETGDETEYHEGTGQVDYGPLEWYRFKVPKDSQVAFPTLDEFIALCQEQNMMNLIKPGYVLAGWYYDGTVYTPGGTPDNVKVSVNTVLTAVWTQEEIQYTISYELGIDLSLANPETYTVTTNGFTLINPSRANNPGYEFIGWTGTGLDEPTMTVTIPRGSTGNREYTAVWKEAAELVITLKDTLNLVLIDNPVRNGVYGEKYMDLNLPIYGNTVKDDVTYVFAGWMIDGGDTIQSGTTIIIDEDHDIIIIWQLKNYYPIYVNGSAQGDIKSNVNRCEFDENGDAKYPAIISITPVSGYYITAITIRDTGKPTTTFVPNLLSATYDDTNGYSLYTETAVFKKKADTANTWTYDYYPHGIAIVTVTFAALEYTVTIHTGVDQSGEATYHYGVGHSITIQAPNDTLTHEFTGWATTSTGEVVYETEIRPGTDFKYGNRVFYEIWEVIKTTYTITFSSTGGVYAPTMDYEYDPEHPHTTVTINNPASWANHKFKGWFENPSFTGEPLVSFDSYRQEDFTLYAKWAEMASFSVYDFVYDGGQHIGVSVYGCTVTSGTDRETQSGDYTATLTLTSGYEWRDTDQIVTKTAVWHITPRPLYLISESVWGSYTGDGYILRIGSTAFTAIGFVGDDEDDLNITVTGERSSPGITATSITCTAKTGHESTLANYNVQTITGTVIVTEPSVATVTVSNGLQPTSGPAAPAIQAAVNPTGSRRWMI